MTIKQGVVLYLCGMSVFAGLLYLLTEKQVMTALFFAVLALAFAVLFDGLREYGK